MTGTRHTETGTRHTTNQNEQREHTSCSYQWSVLDGWAPTWSVAR
jgi:hypothetical protein